MAPGKKYVNYAIPLGKGEPAATLKGDLVDFSSETLHTHDCHQFLLIRNGVSLLIDETRKQPLYGSMCAFIPAGFPHRTVVAGGSIRYQSVYLRKNKINPWAGGITIYPVSALGRELLNSMVDDPSQNFRKGLLPDILELFLKTADIEMKSGSSLLSLPESVSPECAKLTAYIEANYMKKLTLDNFRSVLPYSIRHISRIFIAGMKMTLFDYLRVYRMITASALLYDREKSILEISLECGYESLSSFYSDFSRYFSGTPGDFRKKQLHDI